MKDLLIVFGMILAAIVFGTLLYFYGPSTFRIALGGNPPSVSVRVLRQGIDATNDAERANYLIHNGTELNELWGYIGGAPDAAPNIDFTKEQVLAVFDGTHTTTGYSIAVSSVMDANGMRMVHVTRTAPGANCTVATAITSPYQIVAVPKSDLAITHADMSETADCP